MNKKKLISLIIAAVLVTVTVLAGMFAPLDDTEKPNGDVLNTDKLTVNFLDVGQGDCEFVEFPNGECMLIDAGNPDDSEYIVEYIEELGFDKIDYLIATHPHSDHIGGMAYVIENFDVGKIYMPKAASNTLTFEKLLETVNDKGLKINTAKAGVTVISDDNLEVKFLSPVSGEYDDLNNYSAVLKADYKNDSFLFMGDAEKPVESELIKNYYSDLDADVLKVGHHGSKYSSGKKFLGAVTPDYAVIEVGAGNTYNHPHSEATNNLENIGAKVFRTDVHGNIIVSCDGKNNFTVDYR